MQFKNIIGQEVLKQSLIEIVNGNRISHALMFTGPEGTGKLAMAIALATFINCENRGQNDSCGVCPSCIKMKKLVHPDLHFVFPVVKVQGTASVSDSFIEKWRETILETPYLSYNNWLSKMGTENKQAQIYTDESKEIIRKISMKSFEAEYKTMIIWLPEKMNIQASNKLLKMLEEPPGKTLFILVSNTPENILQTIYSRTQIIKFPKLRDIEIKNALEAGYSADKTEGIVNIANGNYAKALLLLDETDNANQNYNYFTNLMRTCYKADILNLYTLVDEITGIGREKQKELLVYFSRMIRENFILNVNKNTEINYMTNKEDAFSSKFHPFIKDSNIEGFYNEVEKAHYHIERNGNPKIIFLDLSFTLIKLLKQ